MLSDTKVERRSEREIMATRTIDGAARLVFEAWTNPALFQRWWVPKSFPIQLRACEMDVRAGGRYRLDYAFGDQVSSFFGTYVEVSAPSRLVWTNDESDEGVTVTTVTFVGGGAPCACASGEPGKRVNATKATKARDRARQIKGIKSSLNLSGHGFAMRQAVLLAKMMHGCRASAPDFRKHMFHLVLHRSI